MIESVRKKYRSKKLLKNSFLLDNWKKCLDFLTSFHHLYNSMKNHVLPGRSIGSAISFYCKHVVSDHVQIWIPFFDFWTDLTNNSYSVSGVHICKNTWEKIWVLSLRKLFQLDLIGLDFWMTLRGFGWIWIIFKLYLCQMPDP